MPRKGVKRRMALFRKRPQREPAPRRSFAELQAMTAEQRAAALAAPDAEAAGWIEAAARHGLAEAQVALGQMRLDGTGVPRDPVVALQWFAAAAAAHYPPGLNMAGRCNEMGWGTAPDLVRAAELYRQAAEAGLDWGQYNLANMLLRGRGVAKDRAQALRWYQLAARQGHAKSMNLVGRFLEHGWEVPADLGAAMQCYAQSAQGGDFRGQFNLGSLLAQQGRRKEALHWLDKAVSHGSHSYLQEAGAALSASDDVEYRALGQRALGLAQQLAAKAV